MSAIYYKATRPDGTDFRTGRMRYEVGQVVEHPTSKWYGDMEPNRPGTYLSVSVEPGEVLTGGEWPCRVFRVQPVGRTVKRTDGVYPFKRGCRAVRVLEELPAHVALGPNGGQVAALIERARSLTADELDRLAAAWVAALAAAWDAAWDAAWAAARAAARAAAGDAARAAARAAALAAAWDAAWGAAVALIARDLITPQQFNALYGPWARAIEATS